MAPNPDKQFPNLPEEEQEVELEPVVMGPPAYGSPDPESNTNTLLPLVDDPMRTAASAADEAAAVRDQANYSKMDKDVLAQMASDRGLEVEGTGANGNVKKSDLVSALTAADAEDMDSRDFISRVEAATDEDQLDEAEEFYENSGKEYASVEKAIDKKRAELEEASS